MGKGNQSKVVVRFVGCHSPNRAWDLCLHPRSLYTIRLCLPRESCWEENRGYQEESGATLSPLSPTAWAQIMLFFSHHNNIVIQLGSTRWSE